MMRPVTRPAVPFAVIRVSLLAAFSVIGAAYAIVRYYTHPHQPVLEPIPAVAPAAEANLADGGEIPAPELVPYEETK